MHIRYIKIDVRQHADYECGKISVINGYEQGYSVDCIGCGLCDVIMGDMRYNIEYGELIGITCKYKRGEIQISFYGQYLICTYKWGNFYHDKKISYNPSLCCMVL